MGTNLEASRAAHKSARVYRMVLSHKAYIRGWNEAGGERPFTCARSKTEDNVRCHHHLRYAPARNVLRDRICRDQ